MKPYRITKTIFYVLCGIFVILFHSTLAAKENSLLPVVVGASMLIFGLDETIFLIATKRVKTELVRFMNQMITILLGLVMFFLVSGSENELVTSCVLWSVWSIMREGEDICVNVLTHPRHFAVAALHALESLAIIVLSVLLIANPAEHHARLHVVMLGVEFLLVVLCPLLDDFLDFLRKKSEKAGK